MTDATKAALRRLTEAGEIQAALERIAELEAALIGLFGAVESALSTFNLPCTDRILTAQNAARAALAALAGEAKAAPRLTDADRYQWLKPRLICADFQYGDPSEACCALVFEIPGDMPVSPDLDATINAAIEAKVRG